MNTLHILMPKKKKVWVSYSHKDNANGDVDFIVQELQAIGLDVRFDRNAVIAGLPLWDQLQQMISSENECDAWVIIMTETSLKSEACSEEQAYALDRALRQGRSKFPIIGLGFGYVSTTLIPPMIRTRLFLNMTTDTDWADRIYSAAHGTLPTYNIPPVQPISATKHVVKDRAVLELHPRVGVWYPAFVSVQDEHRHLAESISIGIANSPTTRQYGGHTTSQGYTVNDQRFYMQAHQGAQVSPTMSMYVDLDLNNLPVAIGFGCSSDRQRQYQITREQILALPARQ